MPAKPKMTWEPKPRRWRKMHKGKLYVVSCRELGVKETKEASYQAADAWWLKKMAEIDNAGYKFVHGTLKELRKRIEWAAANDELEMAEEYRRKLSEAEAIDACKTKDILEKHEKLKALNALFPYAPDLDERLRHLKDMGIKIPEDLLSPLLDKMFGDRDLWDDRFRRGRKVHIPEDRTVVAQVERFLALERARVEGEIVSVGEYEIVTRALHDFRDWILPDASIELIDADRIESWWSHLVALDISVETKKKKMRHVKTFVIWLAEKSLIAAPTNLHSRRHRFGGGARIVRTLPHSEVKSLIESAPGQLRLHLLLMANAGMTQIDISDLNPAEVDWERGRIRRKRSKTDDHPNVPVVEYLLWPETFELLKKYGHRSGDRALLTSSGLPWVRDVLKPDGKRSKVDNIKSNFAHIKRRKGLKFSMKILRKTSASLLESESEFARYATLFLGHSPRSIAERHYVAPSQENFDRAIKWLAMKYEIFNEEIKYR